MNMNMTYVENSEQQNLIMRKEVYPYDYGLWTLVYINIITIHQQTCHGTLC